MKRLLLSILALACLLAGVALFALGFPPAGLGLAVSSAALLLLSIFIREERAGDYTRLEKGLDIALIVVGLVAFVLTRDLFFLSSVVIVLATNDSFEQWFKERWRESRQ